jgi:LCP family protein required for cell wall assembly
MNRHEDLIEDGGGQAPQGRRLSRILRRRRAPGARRSVTHRVVAWMSVFVVAVLVAGALVGYLKYRTIWDSIKRVDVHQDLATRRPAKFGNALNILLIGSDSRAGANVKFGAGVQGQRSDTVMLLHISPGRKHATVLSFPRDSVVPVLSCPAEAGATGQQAGTGQIEQLNSTFAYGGPGCLWTTVEQTTHIHVDHFIELNFTGFEKVINDLGGVNICLPFAVNDANSKLHLSSGPHHVMGAQALAFWRARYIGQGSDLQRIRRDQYLMASIVQGATHSNLLSTPARLYSVVTDAAGAMTTDTDLDLGTMIKILESMKGLSSQSVQFVEVPSVPYPLNNNWVQWAPQAAALFTAVAHDKTLPKISTLPKFSSKSALGARLKVTTAPPSPVGVEVLNGSGVAGIAGIAANDLTRGGFHVLGTRDAPAFGYTGSVIEYASHGDLRAARALKARVSGAVLEKNPGLTASTLELIVGSSFAGVHPPSPHKPKSSSVSNLAGTYGGITGSANVCHDSSAFTGPDGGS